MLFKKKKRFIKDKINILLYKTTFIILKSFEKKTRIKKLRKL